MMLRRLEKLPKVEPKPAERLVCSREKFVECMDGMAKRGWNVELKHYRGYGWHCEIKWMTTLDAELQKVVGRSLHYIDKKGKKHSYQPAAYDAFLNALYDLKPKWEEWAKNNQNKAKEAARPELVVL